MVKNLPAMQETRVPSLGREDPLEKGTAAHSSILAWRIPWTEEPAGYSLWGLKESDKTATKPPPPTLLHTKAEGNLITSDRVLSLSNFLSLQ